MPKLQLGFVTLGGRSMKDRRKRKCGKGQCEWNMGWSIHKSFAQTGQTRFHILDNVWKVLRAPTSKLSKTEPRIQIRPFDRNRTQIHRRDQGQSSLQVAIQTCGKNYPTTRQTLLQI